LLDTAQVHLCQKKRHYSCGNLLVDVNSIKIS
jgi:hypothetical protein